MREVDLNLVFCIEATARMQPYSTEIAEFTTRVANLVVEDLKRDILLAESDIRIFLLLFRNCKFDGESSLELLGPIDFSKEESQFQEALLEIEYFGGGRHVDPRCSGLEAIWGAMHILQRYKHDSFEHRHRIREAIIVVAKSRTNPLGNNMGNSCLTNTPDSFEKLADSWNDEIKVKDICENGYWKMILVTPDESSWHRMAEEWYNVCHEPFFDCRNELSEYDFKFFADFIGARS